MTLRKFNRLSPQAAEEVLKGCLVVERWVQEVSSARPFKRLDDVFEAAREAAFPFNPAEVEAALAAQQPITVVPPARVGETLAEARVREQLAEGVQHYQRRFGRPFVVRVEGCTSTQILVELWQRLGNYVDAEDQVLAQQLRQIALVRLANTISY